MKSKIAAFKVCRRSISAAVFAGQTLDYIDTQHLSNVPEAAADAAERFISWIIENFHPEVAALSVDEEDRDQQLRAQVLTKSAKEYLLYRGIPVWKTTDSELLQSYAIPALTNKKDLRQIGRSIWPHIEHEQVSALDAALVGLYVQTERLLSHN